MHYYNKIKLTASITGKFHSNYGRICRLTVVYALQASRTKLLGKRNTFTLATASAESARNKLV